MLLPPFVRSTQYKHGTQVVEDGRGRQKTFIETVTLAVAGHNISRQMMCVCVFLLLRKPRQSESLRPASRKEEYSGVFSVTVFQNYGTVNDCLGIMSRSGIRHIGGTVRYGTVICLISIMGYGIWYDVVCGTVIQCPSLAQA